MANQTNRASFSFSTEEIEALQRAVESALRTFPSAQDLVELRRVAGKLDRAAKSIRARGAAAPQAAE